jgi:23S rRNA (cytosine1962-C5)-methyltransferase
MLPAVTLNRRIAHRLLQGHVWVYASEIERVHGNPAAGDVVVVQDHGGRPLAWGFFNPTSKIAVRVLTRRERPIDRDFLSERIRNAVAHRDTILPGRPARRLVNSEGDLLPGLIVDQYADVLVVQCTTAGIDRRLSVIVEILCELIHPRAILERNDIPVRAHEGLEQRTGVLFGKHDGPIRVRVGDVEFPCDPLNPHKTGLYLDQQLTWQAVAQFVRPGARFLDVFCHLGGFALHALRAGAGHALAIDSAQDSITGAKQGAVWAGVSDRLTTRCDNAFDVLKELDAAGQRFDVIVLDPPSFSRSKATVEGALRGYKEIHLRALRMLEPGGVLATFSCSHHINAQTYMEMIVDAANDAHRLLRREAIYGASPDHPVLPAVPESEYLKGFALRVLAG